MYDGLSINPNLIKGKCNPNCPRLFYAPQLMPRMQILTTQEQENFNKPPLFDHMQRKQFFDFPKKLLDIARSY